jgi:hypothetical protein
MRVFIVMLVQIVISLLVAGLILPAILFSVPATREAGPVVLLLLVAVLFALLRLAWPVRKPSV